MMLFRKLLVLFIMAHCCMASALSSDRVQPISVSADYAERNELTGLTQYRGNVIIRQGSILIDAEEVTIHYEDDTVSRILCLGSPASYQQISLDDTTLVIAKAETIEYLLVNDIINLKTNASLARNGTFIKGDTINYDLAKGTWKAKGDDQSDQKRIQLVIPPFKQNGTAIDEPVRTGVSSDNLGETN